MMTENKPSRLLSPSDDGERMRTARRTTFLLELSLALALPPEAREAPAGIERPAIRPEPRTLLDVGEVAAVLDRPTVEVGRGRVSAGQLDWRLDGLAVSLGVFRVSGEDGAVVSLSVVGPDPGWAGRLGATAANLWWLATTAVAHLGVASEHVIRHGDDGFMALYGGRTAQLAWLTGERVATVSVTSLAGDADWAMRAARALADLADDRLEAASAEPGFGAGGAD